MTKRLTATLAATLLALTALAAPAAADPINGAEAVCSQVIGGHFVVPESQGPQWVCFVGPAFEEVPENPRAAILERLCDGDFLEFLAVQIDSQPADGSGYACR